MAELLDLIDGGPVGTVAAVLGGGGKTTLIERLGEELAEEHPRVLLSSLTKTLGRLSRGAFNAEELLKSGFVVTAGGVNPVHVLGPLDDEGKASGIDPAHLEALATQASVTVFECDGARNLPFKVHNERDPSVPEFATHAVVVVGAEVVGTTLEQGLVHRPDLFAERWNVEKHQSLTAKFIAGIITNPLGYLSKIPANLKIVYFINKADLALDAAMALGREVAELGQRNIFYGSLHKNWIEKIL